MPPSFCLRRDVGAGLAANNWDPAQFLASGVVHRRGSTRRSDLGERDDARMLPALVALIDDQRGVVARHQVVRRCPRQVADDLLRSGRFGRTDPLIRGVYRLRGSGTHPEQFAFAAALRAWPKATLTGPLALGLLGVPGFDTTDPFEVLVQPGRCLTNVPFDHREDPDPGRPVAEYGEVRVVGPIDALIDAAPLVPASDERRLRVAWDHLRWNDLATTYRLRTRLDELRGRAPGVPRLEQVLDASGGVRLESEGERRLAPVLRCFDPAPEPQVWVTRARRVDFYFRALRLVYEYLGEADHGTLMQRIEDDQRDEELRRAGVRTKYITARDLDDPVALLAQVAGVLVVRAHELGVTAPRVARALPT